VLYRSHLTVQLPSTCSLSALQSINTKLCQQTVQCTSSINHNGPARFSYIHRHCQARCSQEQRGSPRSGRQANMVAQLDTSCTFGWQHGRRLWVGTSTTGWGHVARQVCCSQHLVACMQIRPFGLGCRSTAAEVVSSNATNSTGMCHEWYAAAVHTLQQLQQPQQGLKQQE
jgi:hypothetical protein